MADLLTQQRRRLDWWPVDKAILAYFGASIILELIYRSRLPAAWLITWHLVAAALLIAAVRRPTARLAHAFRHWYPLPYVAACYGEVRLLIPVVRGTDFDSGLARLDFAIWGAHPTVWLERWLNPWAAEILQIIYAGFVPAVLLVAFLLWRQRRYREFRYYAFLIAVGFLASYVGYLIVPARGPRFVLAPLQTQPLRGVWLFDWLRTGLDRLESAHYDCFPSGHTELTMLACWGSRVISPKLFRVMLIYTLGVVFATVYLRYHYTMDILAGALLAVFLIWATPRLYRLLGGETA